MRSFSLVLLRRLLFRSTTNQTLPLYDHLSAQTLATIERLLLHILLHEPTIAVRRKATDTISEVANYSMSRGRPWHSLQQQAFQMTESEDPITRENAYRVFAGSPNLIMDLRMDSVIGMLQKGLQDPQSVDVSVHRSPVLFSPLQAANVAAILVIMRPCPHVGSAASNPPRAYELSRCGCAVTTIFDHWMGRR